MKLIDADNLHNAKFPDTSGFGEAVAYRVGWNDAIDAICENEPTIDVVEVVCGEWVNKMNYRDGSYYSICSECGYFDDERDDLTAYNFCPNCGVRMRGADDE